uniref:Anaphylatoxin-like domain-containing protein n=1 Tax=Anas zonorhyncha TaxID=75864 RepID=A0A8B9U733_9AVES
HLKEGIFVVVVISASKYKHPAIKKCCMAGVKAYPVGETCSDRARRIQSNEKCISAFKDCCEFANRLRDEEPYKLLMLPRTRKYKNFDCCVDIFNRLWINTEVIALLIY